MKQKNTPRGFTLVEMMVVVAIVGVMATLAGVGLMYGNARAKLSNSVFEVSSLVPVAQMRAAASGKPNYLVFYSNGSTFGVAHIERDETTAPPAWSTVSAADLSTIKGKVLTKVEISSSKALSLGKVTALTSLPAPYKTVPLTTPGTSGLLGACTFCINAGTGQIGALRFWQDGRITVATGASDTPGAAFALTGTAPGEKTRTKVMAVMLPSGSMRVVEP